MGPVPDFARNLCRFTAGGPVLPVALVAGLSASLAYAAIPCGTRDGALREPTANDALFVLEAAVGLPGRCGLCLCDVDSGGSITIRDAVLVLQRATGAGAALECPSCPCTARVRQPDAYDYDIALADFNGDGLGDFASRDGSRQLSVWLARGRGVLERSIVETDIGGWRSRVVAADVDGDGFADIVTNDEAYRDLVLIGGNGDGTFREPEPFLTVSAEDVLFEDLNNDGAVDLVTSGFDPPAIVVRLGDGAGGFGPELTSPTAVALYEIRLGDLNGDSAPDLVGIADYGSAVIVMFGHGDGTFGVPGALATGDDPSAVAIGDFDADGRADIAVADTRDTVIRVYHGTESSGFESPREVPIGGGGYALEAGDLDADGIVDLVVGQRRADIAILHGSATGLLDARLLAVRDSARRVSLTDVDADSDLDLIALADGVLVMLGHGDGTFAAERTSRASARTTALMLGDVDADGVTDLITAEDPSLSAYAGEGTGAFGWRVLTPLSDRPRSSFASDVDTDGFVDVIIAMWGALSEGGYSLSHVSVLRGNGDGHFDAPDPIAGLLTSSIAHGDVDNDGLVDIAAVVHDPTRIEIFTGDGVGGFQSTHGFEASRSETAGGRSFCSTPTATERSISSLSSASESRRSCGSATATRAFVLRGLWPSNCTRPTSSPRTSTTTPESISPSSTSPAGGIRFASVMDTVVSWRDRGRHRCMSLQSAHPLSPISTEMARPTSPTSRVPITTPTSQSYLAMAAAAFGRRSSSRDARGRRRTAPSTSQSPTSTAAGRSIF